MHGKLVSDNQPTAETTITTKLKCCFSTGTREFKCFRETWNTIIETSNLGGLEKLALLKSRLTGRAAQATDHLDISNENYPEAWEILSERYENARVLFEDEWTALLALPNLTGKNPDGFLQMMESVKNIFANIRSMGIDPYSGPSFTAVTIINKFDKAMQSDLNVHQWSIVAMIDRQTAEACLRSFRVHISWLLSLENVLSILIASESDCYGKFNSYQIK